MPITAKRAHRCIRYLPCNIVIVVSGISVGLLMIHSPDFFVALDIIWANYSNLSQSLFKCGLGRKPSKIGLNLGYWIITNSEFSLWVIDYTLARCSAMDHCFSSAWRLIHTEEHRRWNAKGDYDQRSSSLHNHLPSPETNIAPENGWLEDWFPVGKA